MKTLFALLCLLPAAAFAQDKTGEYKDSPSAEWFANLNSPSTKRCCDQADCRRAASDYRIGPAGFDAETQQATPGKGEWWAQSNRTGKWVHVPNGNITRDKDGNVVYSIFAQAVLCEGDPGPVWDTVTGAMIDEKELLYCFAPPPLGF